MSDLNRVYFSKEQIESGEFTEFLTVLMKHCYGEGEMYSDIHIFPEDLGAFSIEWIQLPWDHEWGGGFKYVDDDETIYREYVLPDRSFIDLPVDSDFEEYLRDWLIDNPGWIKTSYGTWTNEVENEKLRQELLTEKVEAHNVLDNELCENGIPQ